MANKLEIKIKLSEIIKFVFPTIIMFIFMSFYSIVDGYCVAEFVNTDALAATTMVMPIIFIFIAVGTMFGAGGSAIVAQKMGKGKSQESKEDFTLILLSSICLATAALIVTLIFIDNILLALGVTELVFDDAKTYVTTILLFAPLFVPSMVFQTLFITAGKPRLGLLFSIIGGCLNIVFDFLLVGYFNLGVFGAAIATGVGFSISGFFGILYFTIQRKGTLFFVKPKFSIKTLADSMINGSSEMVTNLSTSVVAIMLNKILIDLVGEDGVSALTVILYGQMILNGIFLGYSVGISPLISFNYGKKDQSNIKKICSLSLKTIAVFSVISFILSYFIAKPIVTIFTPENSAVYELAIYGFNLFAISFIFMGFGIFASAFFTSLSNGKISALISFFRTFLFIFVALALLPNYFGITGIWIAIPLAEFLSAILSFYLLKKYKKTYGY